MTRARKPAGTVRRRDPGGAESAIVHLATRMRSETGIDPIRHRGFAAAAATAALIDQLSTDAEAALAGDVAAGEALRACLIGLWEHAAPDDLRTSWGTSDGQRSPLGNRHAAETIAVAAAQAGATTDEVERMLSALVVLFVPISWAERCASLPGERTGRLRALLAAAPPAPRTAIEFVRGNTMTLGRGLPTPDPGGRDGHGLRVPTIPGTIDIDGLFPPIDIPSRKGPPKIVFDPQVPGGLRRDIDIVVEPCILTGAREMSRVRDTAPRWSITSISDPAACPGSLIVLHGSGFGTSGTVRFPGPDEAVAATDVRQWSDTEIHVVVPRGVCPGTLSLEVAAGSAVVCGKPWPVSRAGASEIRFGGGTPVITHLQPDWVAGPIVAPGTDFSVHLGFTAGAGVTGEIAVWNGGAPVARLRDLVTGQDTVTLHAPRVATPVTLTVVATVANACGTAERRLRVLVAVAPRLSVVAAEAVQGVQRPDPAAGGPAAVELAAHRATAVRVVIASGLPAHFTWGAKPSSIPLVGVLSVGAVKIASDQPHDAPHDPTRASALTFVVPDHLCEGTKQFTVTVRPAHPDVPVPAFSITHRVTVAFTRERHITLTMLRVWDRHGHRAAPSEAAWRENAATLIDRMPVGPTGILVRAPLGGSLFSTWQDLGDKPGWDRMLDEIEEFAAEHTDHGDVWLGLTPQVGGTIAGVGIAAIHKGWFERDTRAVCAVQQGLPASFAHEIGHTLGFRHTESPAFPLDDAQRRLIGKTDKTMPGELEKDALGWRASDGAVFTAPWPDLMSYGTPSSNQYQDRWPTAAMWRRLLEML